MFDLEQEVAAWSQTVHADRCRHAESVAELSDHLLCEIERARAQGLSDEQAFAAAVAKLGAGSELAAEHAKNRSLLGSACAVAARHERAESRGQGGLLMAHAIIWAALILGTSLILSKTDAGAFRSLLLTVVLLPTCWWASEQVLRRALRNKGAS